jgi:hypothetical protein
MIQGIAIEAVERAAWDRLRADLLMVAYRNSIFRFVPTTTAFPYIRIGDAVMSQKGARDHSGEEVSLLVHVFSEYASDRQAAEIVNRAVRALTTEPLVMIDGYTQIHVWVDTVQTMRDDSEPARNIYHAVATLRWWVETAS